MILLMRSDLTLTPAPAARGQKVPVPGTQDKNYECRALTLSNDFVSRDEGLHRNFAVALYNKFMHNLSAAEVSWDT